MAGSAHSPASTPENLPQNWHRPVVEPKLPARIEAVRQLCAEPFPATNESISQTHVVADIACDHCTLGIALLKSKVAQRVIAVDVCPSPLDTGRTKAARLLTPELRACLDLRLGDGLRPLKIADRVNTVCVVGIGAYSVLNILDSSLSDDNEENDMNQAQGQPTGSDKLVDVLGVQRLVLQPVDSRPHLMVPLRRWLLERGWRITDETLSANNKRQLYLTMLAERDRDGGIEIKTDIFSTDDEPSSAGEIGGKATRIEDLILPQALRRRMHRILHDRFSDGGTLDTGKHDTQRMLGEKKDEHFSERASIDRFEYELLLWKRYVKLHHDWIAVARFDAYDKKSGLPPGAIAAVMAMECDTLRNFGLEL